MAKKVVATLKTSTGKSFAKVIRMVRSPKTNAYVFQEDWQTSRPAGNGASSGRGLFLRRRA